MSELLDRIKAADNKTPFSVDVKEWGVTVYIKQMTVGERDAFELAVQKSKKNGIVELDNIRSRFLAMTLCDSAGQLLCKPDEFAQLATLSASPMERLFDIASKQNGLSKDDVETLAGN